MENIDNKVNRIANDLCKEEYLIIKRVLDTTYNEDNWRSKFNNSKEMLISLIKETIKETKRSDNQ